jgi:cation transport ATPase
VLVVYVLACVLGAVVFAAAAFVLFLINYAYGGEVSFILSLPLALALGLVVWKLTVSAGTGLWRGRWGVMALVAVAVTGAVALVLRLSDTPDPIVTTPISLILMMLGGLALVVSARIRARRAL